jgi:molybdopterin molybdotransferase
VRLLAGFEWQRVGGRCEYLRARVDKNQQGESEVTLFANQGSGVLTSTSWANGFAIIPPNTRIEKGDEVAFISFNEY